MVPAEKKRKKPFNGQIILLYIILYSLERFFVEGLRTDSLMIGSLRQAQVISIAVFVLGIVFYMVLRSRPHSKKTAEVPDYTDISDIINGDE